MIRALVLLAALAGAGAAADAQTRASADRDFRASGSEPFWTLRMDGRTMVFSDGEETGAPQPPLRRHGATRSYATRRLIVTIAPGPCEDEAGYRYVNTVRVRRGATNYEGCGGFILPPEQLALTSWRILAINGADVSADPNYQLDFGEGVLEAHTGCNRLTGAYAETGRRLTAGPISVTQADCPRPLRADHERAVIAILEGRPQISYPNPPSNAQTIMVLTSPAGTLRLQRQ